MVERVVLVSPRGFCAGAVRSIEMVKGALAHFGPPVFVRRPIVHNPYVVEHLESLGAVFVPEVDAVPVDGVVVFSAHGVAQSVREAATARGLTVVDATCPLVAKVHYELRRYLASGREVVLIGHAGHDEVVGTLGQAPGQVHLVQTVADVEHLPFDESTPVACISQTTLNPHDVESVVRALQNRFPDLALPLADDVCFATRNRQMAVRWIAEQVDLVLVLGDKTSSNSRRLVEVASAAGKPAYLIGRIGELQSQWLDGAGSVGLTSGASTPEFLVEEAVSYFERMGAVVQTETLLAEQIVFRVPSEIGRQSDLEESESA